jgi:hypothetical protein
MLTPQDPDKRLTLKGKQLLFNLSPHKWKEHERAVKFIESIPRGQGVHTIVEALNYYQDHLKEEGEGKTTDERLSEIEAALADLRGDSKGSSKKA